MRPANDAASSPPAGPGGSSGPSPVQVTGPGTVLSERYRLEAPIAAGGMSAVWRALDERLGRPVAVKLMRDDLLADPAARERFEREAQLVACLASPHVVSVYDVGIDGDRRYLVMELVEGESLADRLGRQGALDPAIAVAVADRVLAALEVAHAGGTVHRDVKPANVLLPADGGVKLADFGIAKDLEGEAAPLTEAGQVLGTPTYLSPEQVAGRPAGPASDVYAVGVLLHEMIAGRPPFEGADPLSVALARQHQDPPRLDEACPAVAPAIADVVARSLARDPDARYPDAGRMRAALSAATPRVEEPGSRSVTVPAGPTGAVEAGDATAGPDDPTAVGAVASADDPTAVGAVASADDPTAVGAGSTSDPAGTTTQVVPVVAAPPGPGSRIDEPTLLVPTPGPVAEPDGGPRWYDGRAPWVVGAVAAVVLLVALLAGAGGSGLPSTDELAAGETAASSDPAPAPADAGSIAELEALLRDHPDRWGARGPELADRLAAVAAAEGSDQGEHARALLADLDAWEAGGELDSEMAERTRELVGPLAMVAEEAPPPREGRGEGRGRGRDRDRDDD